MKFGFKIFFLCISIYIISMAITSIVITERSYSEALNNNTVQMLDKEEEKLYVISTMYNLTKTPEGNEPDIEDYIKWIADMIGSKDIYTVIFDKKMNIAFNNFKQEPDNMESDLRMMLSDNRNHTIKVIDGRQFLIIADFLQIGTQKLYFSLIQDISYIDRERKDQYLLFIQAGLLGLLVAILITPFISRIIINPIKKLTEAVKCVADGNYKSKVQIAGKDEIGILAGHFNIMAEEIDAKVNELYREGERKQRFIDNLTHELRTPLTSIIGYAELLRSAKYDEAVFYKSTGFIHSEGNRMLKLINNLMDVILLRKQEINKEQYNTKPLFEEVMDIMKIKSAGKGIQLKNEGQDIMVLMDRDLMKGVLVNLTDNAINASPPGSDVVLGSKITGDCACIYVTDHGKGIPENEMLKVTDPFYRVDKSRSRADGGIGLGLSICSEILKLHNAELKIESEIDKGTTITIVF
jgi:signal transduction histidine kinase